MLPSPELGRPGKRRNRDNGFRMREVVIVETVLPGQISVGAFAESCCCLVSNAALFTTHWV